MQHCFSSEEDFVVELASYIVDRSKASIQDHGYFAVAFSGGSAATMISKSLSQKDVVSKIEWPKWHIFFSDERYVELTDPDSNFKSIDDNLLSNLPINRNNVYAMDRADGLSYAAEDYESKLRTLFSGDFPIFDLVVLGMGPDGHICSLFPNHPLLDESTRWIGFLDDSPKPPPERITLTLPVINKAKSIIFITTGEGKAENIRRAIEEDASKEIPASLVKAEDGEVHWFMDTGAASLLQTRL